MEKKIKNEIYRCQDCPAYVPGCCTVDNMPADGEHTCKFTGMFKNLREPIPAKIPYKYHIK